MCVFFVYLPLKLNNKMRRVLGGLLLSTRKVRVERSSNFYGTHHPLHIGHQQRHDQPQIPFFIRSKFCFTSTSASSSHPDLRAVAFAMSTQPPFSSSSSQPTESHDVQLAAKDFMHGEARGGFSAEKIVAREFSYDVSQCEVLSEENASDDSSQEEAPEDLSTPEAHKLLRLMKVEDLKRNLQSTGKNCMPLEEVICLCKQMGAAINDAEAEELVKSLDEAGAIFVFRRKVFLEPAKVAEVLSKAMPVPLVQEDDPRNEEFLRLQKEKEEIDQIAHKQVRHMLWGALGALSAQTAIFFRLTFWELSWDVMEPIAFFVTSSSLLAGFFFFVITNRDPSYHDFMDTLFSSKQRKLMKKRNFDLKKFKELQVMCCLPPSRHFSRMQRELKYAY